MCPISYIPSMPCILRDLMFHKPCALCSPFFTCFVPFVMPCLTFLIQNMLFLLWAWLVSYVLYILRVLLDLIPYIPQVLCALLSYEPCRLLCFSRSLFKMLCALCNVSRTLCLTNSSASRTLVTDVSLVFCVFLAACTNPIFCDLISQCFMC